jgi:hypothetical protein
MSSEHLDGILASMSSIDLVALQSAADLQTRVDRKYLVAPATVLRLFRAQESQLCVLEIDGARRSRYESVYFDTPQLDSYRATAHGRRHRVKVRTRSYLDSGLCMLEIKRASARGGTIKDRMDYPLHSRHRIELSGRDFLLHHAVGTAMVDALRVTLVTEYIRTTLLAPDGSRTTIDRGLRCVSPEGDSCTVGDLAVVETKSAGLPTAVDRALWRLGHRPEPISKYGTGLAALTPSLPANKWNRTLHRHFRMRTGAIASPTGEWATIRRPLADRATQNGARSA